MRARVQILNDGRRDVFGRGVNVVCNAIGLLRSYKEIKEVVLDSELQVAIHRQVRKLRW